MSQHILYTFRRCPYAIRARMALACSGISLELRELLLKDKPTDMLEHSPKGTVPVLITVEGRVIDESLDVLHWALGQNDLKQWRHATNTAEEWVEKNDHQFKPLLDRYKYADRHPELSEEQHRENTLWFIEKLNKQLSQTEHLLSDQASWVDVAIFPFIRQYAMVNKKWFDQQPYPALQRWLNEWLNEPLFINVMKKYKLYNDGHSYHWPDDLNNE